MVAIVLKIRVDVGCNGVRSNPQAAQATRALRSVVVIFIFTVGAVYLIGGDVTRPHGNPFLYALAISWLISFIVWDRRSIRAFRWVLLRSPLGWINPNLYLSDSRSDRDRLLRELNAAEGVHWLTCFLASLLGIAYLVRGHAVYGYVLLLVRIPYDLFPIMVQRRNRGRVCRVLSLRTSRLVPRGSIRLVRTRLDP
jgi:hypothetical protein